MSRDASTVVEGNGDIVFAAPSRAPEAEDGDVPVARLQDPSSEPGGASDDGSRIVLDGAPVSRQASAISTISGNDPQIAASKRFLLVSANGTLALYDKLGHAVAEKHGSAPYTRRPIDIFAPLWDPHWSRNINAGLNLPRGFPCQANVDPAHDPSHARTKYCLDDYYDTRVAYDFDRDRFWIVALARNSCARNTLCLNGGDSITDPVILQARRSYLLIAVTKTNDPRDGFVETWFGGAVDEAACNAPNDQACENSEYRPGDAADYPSIAVTDRYLVVSVNVANVITAVRDPDHKARYSEVRLISADQFARALPSFSNWVLWNFTDYDDNVIRGGLTPAVPLSHDPNTTLAVTQSNRLTVVAFNSLADGTPNVFVRGAAFLGHDFTRPVDPPLPGTSDKLLLSNLGNGLTGLVKLHSTLTATAQDCFPMHGGGCQDGARVLQVDVSAVVDHSPLALGYDRTFVGSDVGGYPTHFGVPGVMSNDRGDLVIDYIRAGKGLFPEMRFLYLFHDGGVHPPVEGLLKRGTYAATGNLDTAGAALDASDGLRVWLAHGFGDAAVRSDTVAVTSVKLKN